MTFRIYVTGLVLTGLVTAHTATASVLPSRDDIDHALSGLGSNNQFDRSKTIDWGVLPGPFYTPELELGVGVALVGMYQADSAPESKISTLSLSGFASSTGAFGLNLNNYTYLDDDRWRFYLSGTLNNVPTNYWGKGYQAGRHKDHLAEYKSQQLRLRPSLLRRVADNTYLGLGWDFSTLNVASPDKPFRDYMAVNNVGSHSVNSGVSATFSYDSRDFLPNARHGQALDLRYTYYAPSIGSDSRFNTTEIQYNYYYPLDEKNVLAFDNFARFASGDVPWDQLSHLGNGRQMRGYYDGRYQDNHIFATQVEYRRKLDWRHGIVFWAGSGTMSDSARHLGGGHWLPNAGVGYRFEFKPRMNVRLDFGVGKQSSGFYFQVGEAF
ncbi:BamA/TamA family outer membrane protein [Morganella psychrotolerans]|uniref:Bacterial surface antigen (D15) domain-containing protein n=1 Tax=Morganella psychrotolerans TaxID=368603 RepID=A0A1B8HAK8_9GAMM|nr:BamA/TamA family outer membrane protein [Morganella psychrotolerans]OBU06118.1 hypothetical protein AYY18_06355 [Morganella psychrotolerans]